MPVLSSTTRCHRVHLPTKNHQKIPLDYQPLNANAYFLPCNCMFLKCICNALAYAKVFQMSSFSKFTVPFMQLHDFLMQLQCKCIAQKCNCNANAFFGQRKENFPPHPLYKEKKKIKKKKIKKRKIFASRGGRTWRGDKNKWTGAARARHVRLACKVEVLRAIGS